MESSSRFFDKRLSSSQCPDDGVDDMPPICAEEQPCSQPMEEGYEEVDIDSGEVELPEEPDLEWYLDHYDLGDPQKVSICRTYASYLVAKGNSGRMRPGPAPGGKRSRD